MQFLIGAKISIDSRQSEKKVINSLNYCMVEIDSKRQFVAGADIEVSRIN